MTPRVSLRTAFSWTDPNFGGGSIQSLRQMPLRVDVNYNWEHGKWHPFVGTGVGAYFMQFKNNGESFGDSETKVGLNAGGGIEYFLHRAVTLKGEARYHSIANVRGGRDPSGLAITGGLKTYSRVRTGSNEVRIGSEGSRVLASPGTHVMIANHPQTSRCSTSQIRQARESVAVVSLLLEPSGHVVFDQMVPLKTTRRELRVQ